MVKIDLLGGGAYAPLITRCLRPYICYCACVDLDALGSSDPSSLFPRELRWTWDGKRIRNNLFFYRKRTLLGFRKIDS